MKAIPEKFINSRKSENYKLGEVLQDSYFRVSSDADQFPEDFFFMTQKNETSQGQKLALCFLIK